jgi:superfamily II DNA helicase RecQ
MVFPDAALAAIAAARPRTLDDLSDVKGVGPGKLARYGAEVLAAVAGSHA